MKISVKTDKIITVIYLIFSVIFTLIGVIFLIEANKLIGHSGDRENSYGRGFASIFVFVVALFSFVRAIIGYILCISFKRRYKKYICSGEIKYIKTNLTIKVVIQILSTSTCILLTIQNFSLIFLIFLFIEIVLVCVITKAIMYC